MLYFGEIRQNRYTDWIMDTNKEDMTREINRMVRGPMSLYMVGGDNLVNLQGRDEIHAKLNGMIADPSIRFDF